MRERRAPPVDLNMLKEGSENPMETGPTPNLPANACLIPRADRLDGNPARGWYFAIMVRASLLRLETHGHQHPRGG